MSLSKDEVTKLASLARIKLSPEEALSMEQEIGQILEYIKQIDEISGDDDIASSEDVVHRNIFREDTHPNESGVYTEKLLENAPAREGDYLKVKKIL